MAGARGVEDKTEAEDWGMDEEVEANWGGSADPLPAEEAMD